jgi:asparagine synthase (glutamine-hydrolysing)
MCGIAGHVDWRGRPAGQAGLVPRMIDLIRYRGPDETVFFQSAHAHLSCCRLAIIDLEPNAQPVTSEDGSLQCVFNGEIYNYLELRQDLVARGHRLRTRSDSEVLVHLFEEFGPDFVHHLNGMFALALWDGKRRELWLARDRFGAKPLFFLPQGETLSFSSEVKALRLVPGADAGLDPEALADYFALGYVPAPRSIFRGLRSLPAGHLLRAHAGGIEERCYWSPPLPGETDPLDQRQALDELGELLDDAIRLRLRSDVPVGFFLSGGVDSGVLVSRSARRDAALQTFSVGFADPAFNELPRARQVAGLAHSRHHECRIDASHLAGLSRVLWHSDQPHSDASFLAIYYLSEMAAREVTVVLSGEGADEIFYGYRKYAELPETAARDRWLGLRRYWDSSVAIFSSAEIARLLPDVAPSADRFDRWTEELRPRPYTTLADDAAFLDQKLLLPGNNLVKPDREGSAHALETRYPYLDYRIAEWMARRPLEMKVRGGECKYLLKRLALETLPLEQVARPKQMFTVPVGEWMRAGLLDVAADPAVTTNPLLHQAEVRRLAREHAEGRFNHTRKLRSILHFARWHQVATGNPEAAGDARTPPRASRFVHAG